MIMENWELKIDNYRSFTFDNVLTIINGKNQRAVEDENGKYPIYGSGGIMGYANDYLCPENTVIVGRKGSINKPIFVQQKFWNVDTAFGLVANKDFLESKYLYYFCAHFDFERLNKAVTIPSLTKADLLKIQIPLPSLAEQKHIAAVLDKCTAVIAKHRQMLEKYDTLIKSQFVEMFGDEPVENGKWRVESLEDVCNLITDGTHKTPNYQTSGIKFISAKNIKNGKIDLSDTKFITEEEYQIIQKRCQLEFGDVLLTKSGSLGDSAIIDFAIPVGLFESLAVLKYQREKINGIYLQELLKMNCSQRQFNSGVKGIAIKHLHLNIIAAVQIPVPPLALQEKFASFVQAVDAQKAKAQKSLEKADILYKSLMQEYFG